MFIADPISGFFSIPDPAPDPGSGSATLVGLIIILIVKAQMFVRAYVEDFSDFFL
jgi:hypothetical protein